MQVMQPYADCEADYEEVASFPTHVGAPRSRVRRAPFVITRSLRAAAAGVGRRWRRERRRRLVGRAYDMALELARLIPRGSRVLDVGCGSGFIAHHLSALLGERVVGIDLKERAAAPIEYRCYDGARFPVRAHSFDAVILCYVLHHARDHRAFLCEVRRAVRGGGLVVVYEDEPSCSWDRAMCAAHGRSWRRLTGPCTFRAGREWRDLFASSGFEVIAERGLSRWRNLAHPVSRRLFLFRAREDAGRKIIRSSFLQ